MFEVQEIEKKIGYVFQNKSLLRKAFTHKSYVNLHGGESNDRMEYLGDAILEMLVSEEQYLSDSRQSAGEMTEKRQKLVSKKPLCKAVERMGVMQYLLMEGGKSNIGEKTVSDLYECLLAAIYFDGGYEAAKAFWKRHPLLEVNLENYKGELQEYLQARQQPLPKYTFLGKEGLTHQPIHSCKVSALGKTAQGKGATKTAAEQEAAKALLEKLKREERRK